MYFCVYSTVIFHIMYNIIINLKNYKNKKKLYKDDKKLERLKNTVNKYMAYLRPTSQSGSRS
jgi:hypothetical protein